MENLAGKNINLKDLNINPNILNFLYRKYKSFIYPITIILVSIVLFFIILIPQVQGLINSQAEADREREKLNIYRQNLSILQSTDEADLTKDLDSLSKVLPGNKDFLSILNNISANAVKAGVSIGDFNFSVGEVLKEGEGQVDSSYIEIKLKLKGNEKSVLIFLESLYKSSPITEVNDISFGGDNAAVTIKYFYKAFAKNSFTEDTQIAPINEADNKLINEVSLWNNEVSTDFLPLNLTEDQVASLSALQQQSTQNTLSQDQ